VKNYGIVIKYDSRSGTHNMYKEFRDITLNAAVGKLYAELSSKHRVRKSSIQIISTAIVPAADTKRVNIQQFHVPHQSFIPYQILFLLTQYCDTPTT